MWNQESGGAPVEALGLRALAAFFTDKDCPLRHYADASACIGILQRSGAGTLNHLEVKQLWYKLEIRLIGVDNYHVIEK